MPELCRLVDELELQLLTVPICEPQCPEDELGIAPAIDGPDDVLAYRVPQVEAAVGRRPGGKRHAHSLPGGLPHYVVSDHKGWGGRQSRKRSTSTARVVNFFPPRCPNVADGDHPGPPKAVPEPLRVPFPRGTTKERGYGSQHRRLKEGWRKKVDAGQASCARCGGWIPPEGLGSRCPHCGKEDCGWDLGHDDQDRTQYSGPEHACCNRATATHKASGRQRQSSSESRDRRSRDW